MGASDADAGFAAREGHAQSVERISVGLNGMTITGFLDAVREAGLVLLDLAVRPDPNIGQFGAVRDALPPGLKPMDLCLSGISCTLAFPHNL